ncbi:MAG: VWA domain-containing protein [Polyangiaceae bacterium]|nr:VWA domain-containing protein [Polyangiaceae bacterium]
MRTKAFAAAAASLFALTSLVVACAPDTGLEGGGGSDDDDDTGSGSGSGKGKGAAETTGTGFGADNGSTGSLNECASESIEAEIVPLTMFIAFDKSGSMGDNNKWNNATSALKIFFADPTAADLEVALRFFPQGGCSETSCDVASCATPQVGVGALTADPAPTDAQEQALINAINNTSPGGGTPISAALQGGLQWGAQYLGQNPDHKVVVILVTDGEPQGCQENIGQIANIAATGLAQNVPTYAVGLQGSNEGQLNQITTAGGGTSFFIGNGNAEQELLEALQAIRGEALACEIPIPTPTMGQFDANLVNVEYTPGGGGTPQTIGKVADEASCGASGGWFYNDPANPETIVLCPASCDTVKVDPDGAIKVVLGCQSIPG